MLEESWDLDTQYSHEMRMYVNDQSDLRGNRSTVGDRLGFRCSSQAFCFVPWPIIYPAISRGGPLNPYQPVPIAENLYPDRILTRARRTAIWPIGGYQ
jgi:hypothetical protein